jgi:hypothetical protein
MVTSAPTVQFIALEHSVSEGAADLQLTMTRSGGSSHSASVDYGTIDYDPFLFNCAETGNAQAFGRCDFTTSVGTVTFAPGETEKTISIPIIDDAYVEKAERFFVQLSNPVGATVGTPSMANVTIQDNDFTGESNPIFNTPFFVRQHYLDFLSREPEASGFDAWVNVLNSCSDVNNDPVCDRVVVSASFFGSPEFQLKGFYVFRFYKLAFNRLPQYAEIIPDMSFVAGSTPQEVYDRKARLAVNFSQRQQFLDRYGALSNTDYVGTLLSRYQLSQLTTPDPINPDGMNQVKLTGADLVSKLDNNSLTRAQVFRAVADSDEVSSAEFNSAFVAMQYYGYLRRTPDNAGYDAWLAYLNSHPSDFRTMVNGFMNSIEYRLRFGASN